MQQPGKERWLWSALQTSRGAIRDLVLMSLFVNILVLSIPVFVLQVYDRVVFHSGLTTLQGLIIGMCLVIGFDYVLRQARSRVFQGIARRVDANIGRALYAKVQSLPMRVLESRASHFWQSIFRDVNAIRNMISGPSAVLMLDLPFAVLFFIVVAIIAPPVAWVLLVFIPLFMILAWRSGSVMQKAAASERETSQNREGLMNEIIAGRATVKALALDETLRPRWEERHADAIEGAQQRGEMGDGYQNLGYIMTLSTTIVITTVGALAILDQQMTIGSLIAANMLGSRLVMPMSQLVSQWRMFTQYRESMKRLNEVFAMPSDRQEESVDIGRPTGAITLEKLIYKYGPDAPAAINGIDGVIGPRGLHGIIGANGSGKSTLLKLIRGVYQANEGRVLLDDADITQFTSRQLAQWVGYLPQECTLFAGTIRDNIAIAHGDADDSEIVEASKRAQAHQFIIDSPDGYAAELTEGGGGLSAGQRQRIVIARTMLREPPVLLLDEPSSNLDKEAELALATTLRAYSRKNTVLVVTHSPEFLKVCDSILVLEKGRVAMAGPAAQVLSRLEAKQSEQSRKAAVGDSSVDTPPPADKPARQERLA
ncbi:MAG: ATP-binding cassette subfamily C protein LapB [Alphaproteobacteria bacterium]|jgi:ATP-binding cassette subfamily C protein LapB